MIQQTVQVRQLEEAIAKINKMAAQIRNNIHSIGEVISINRPKYGRDFMNKLPDIMPQSFWLGCELAFLGVIDERILLMTNEKARLLKGLPKNEQTELLDNGININGKQLSIDELTLRELSDILNIGRVDKDGRFFNDPKIDPTYEVLNGRLSVNRKHTFTKEELMMIVESM